MGLAAGDIVINLTGNSTALAATLQNARGLVKGFVSQVGGMIAGLGGVGLGGFTLYSMVAEAGEAVKSQKRLEAVMRATGGSVGVSSDELLRYAEILQDKTGVEQEAIQDSMSALMTFGNVSGKVFKDAIRLAVDMAAVFQTDVHSATMQLGKALAGPTEGLTALRRAGILFTEAEREKIKALEESGRLLEAQQMILTALEGKVGGAAEATKGHVAGMKIAWKELLETVGMGAKPGTDKVFGAIEDSLKAAKILIDNLGNTKIESQVRVAQPVARSKEEYLGRFGGVVPADSDVGKAMWKAYQDALEKRRQQLREQRVEEDAAANRPSAALEKVLAEIEKRKELAALAKDDVIGRWMKEQKIDVKWGELGKLIEAIKELKAVTAEQGVQDYFKKMQQELDSLRVPKGLREIYKLLAGMSPEKAAAAMAQFEKIKPELDKATEKDRAEQDAGAMMKDIQSKRDQLYFGRSSEMQKIYDMAGKLDSFKFDDLKRAQELLDKEEKRKKDQKEAADLATKYNTPEQKVLRELDDLYRLRDLLPVEEFEKIYKGIESEYVRGELDKTSRQSRAGAAEYGSREAWSNLQRAIVGKDRESERAMLKEQVKHLAEIARGVKSLNDPGEDGGIDF